MNLNNIEIGTKIVFDNFTLIFLKVDINEDMGSCCYNRTYYFLDATNSTVYELHHRNTKEIYIPGDYMMPQKKGRIYIEDGKFNFSNPIRLY